MRSDKRKNQNTTNTNMWDVLKLLINGVFNLFKLEKVISLVVVYFLFRDAYVLLHIKEENILKNHLISPSLIEKIFVNDNLTISFLTCIAICLMVIIIVLICNIVFIYKREIERLTKERSQLLHAIDEGKYERLKIHRSSTTLEGGRV